MYGYLEMKFEICHVITIAHCQVNFVCIVLRRVKYWSDSTLKEKGVNKEPKEDSLQQVIEDECHEEAASLQMENTNRVSI